MDWVLLLLCTCLKKESPNICFGDPVYFLIKQIGKTVQVGQVGGAEGGTSSQRSELLMVTSPRRWHVVKLAVGTGCFLP